MITCSICGKPIDKLPSWLAGTKVDFVCKDCPNRSAKSAPVAQAEEKPEKSVRAEESDEEEVADDVDEA